MEVFRTKSTVFECFVNHEECMPTWLKDDVPIKVN